MKLVIQIPCLNESKTLPETLADIPARINGIDDIEIIVVDDGSTDNTSDVARGLGVAQIIKHPSNLGLAAAFKSGVDAALRRGADIIVNTDADHQYSGSDIPALVAPIVANRAGMVIGDRQTSSIVHFSWIKRILQRMGSSVVANLSGCQIPDAASGFRAFSREAALKFTVLSPYTYTHELILQARIKGIKVESVPIKINQVKRPSRLMRSMPNYIIQSLAGILRIFTMYNPLRVFLECGLFGLIMGGALVGRFLYYYLTTGESGKIQSLVIGSAGVLGGVLLIVVGVLADLIQFNRRLLEDILERTKKLELGDNVKDQPR